MDEVYLREVLFLRHLYVEDSRKNIALVLEYLIEVLDDALLRDVVQAHMLAVPLTRHRQEFESIRQLRPQFWISDFNLKILNSLLQCFHMSWEDVTDLGIKRGGAVRPF